MKALLIAIVGGSGSGKSWLADRLQAALAPHAVRVSLDDFYHDSSHLSLGRRARRNFDHPRALDWVTLERALTRLRRGQAARVPRYDFATHARQSGDQRVEPRPVVLVEGLLALHHPALRALYDLGVFVTCPPKVRLERRLERDVAARGRVPADVRRQFREQVEPMHVRYVEPQQQWADLVLEPPIGAAEVRRVAAVIRRLAALAG